MPFFMNPFDHEYRGHLVLGDRQYTMTFAVPGNVNRSVLMRAFNVGPYDLSAGGVLTFNYAKDSDYKGYATLDIDVTGTTPTATTADEIVAILNANPTFTWLFEAVVKTQKGRDYTTPDRYVLITSKLSNTEIRAFVSNTGAEAKLRFNKRAGISEIPSYFSRHTIANRFTEDSDATLIQLDGTVATDLAIIREHTANPSWTTADLKKDYTLFGGRSGLFTFRKNTVDGSDRITQTIEYPAGAQAGDLAKMIVYTYTSANKSPTTYAEMPYTLIAADILTP
jgi:hypothetical protein